jgi:ATP-dependent Clp protease ATP-binding subunit ClpC
LEEGRITDAKGRTVDFKNTIVIMTSNLGSDRFGKTALGFSKVSDATQRHDRETRESAKKFFKPELLNRLDELVVFGALQPAEIKTITSKFLETLSKRLFATSSISLFVAPEALDFLANEGFDETYGARPLRRTVQRLVEDPLSELLLTGLVQQGDVVTVDVKDNTITVRPETTINVAEATETSA